jgi:hypothetical protein
MVEAQTPWFGDGRCVTSGDHERGLLAPFYHCWCPRGVAYFYLVKIKYMTHTRLETWRPHTPTHRCADDSQQCGWVLQIIHKSRINER